MITIVLSLVKFSFLAILICSSLHVSVTHAIAFIERRLERMVNFFLPNEEKEPSTWIFFKSYLLEIFCTIMTVFLLPIKYLPFRPKEAGRRPILLVHGYLHNQTAWIWLRRELEKKGLGPIYSLNLSPPFASIPHLSEKLAKKVNSILEETECSNVILIGHSMGGLVSSFFTEYLADKDQVSRVITIASPFHGTRLAALGRGHNVAEMVPNSAFLEELRQRICASKTPYYLVASKLDNIVVPWSSAVIEESGIQRLVLNNLGHLSLLISPVVADQIVEWINEDPSEDES